MLSEHAKKLHRHPQMKVVSHAMFPRDITLHPRETAAAAAILHLLLIEYAQHQGSDKAESPLAIPASLEVVCLTQINVIAPDQ